MKCFPIPIQLLLIKLATTTRFFLTTYRAFEMRLAERISTGMQQVCLKEDSEPQRTMLGNLRPQGRKGSVGAKRTGHATLGM